MGNNNNPSQGQVPDHRLDEMKEMLRRNEEENKNLRKVIDQMAVLQRQQAQPPPQQEASDFDPRVDQALTKKFQAMAEQVEKRIMAAQNLTWDRTDQIDFKQRWGVETHDKYKDKINSLRSEAANRGQWMSHEDAYKHIYFEENSRKPQPKPEKAQQPYFDSYTGQVVAPEAPVDQALAAPAQQPQQQQQAQSPQQPQRPQQQSQAPTREEDNFNLPPATVNPGFSGSPSAPGAKQKVDLAAGDKELDAWADKYGDQPL